MDVMKETRLLVDVMNEAVMDWAESAIPRSYAKGERTARTALEILGKKPRKPAFTDSRRGIIDDTATVLIRANNSIPATVEQYLGLMATAARAYQGASAQIQEFQYYQAAGTLDALAEEAVRQQQARSTLSAKLKDFFRTFVEDDAFIQIGNRMYRMSKYAEMVARTTLREAQTAATKDLCNQYENDLVQWSDHGTVCDECGEYEGKIYSLSGHHPTYPLIEAEPPLHPNCMHSLLPTSDIALEARERFQ
jgi:hypothetical protein